jgi:hypothetical protein
MAQHKVALAKMGMIYFPNSIIGDETLGHFKSAGVHVV